MINSAAIFPDFTTEAKERSDVTHLDHGVSKLVKEEALVFCKCLNQLPSVLHASREKHFIGIEEPLSPENELEIGVIESCRRAKVQGGYVVVTT